MNFKSKMKFGLLNAIAAFGVIMLSSAAAWAKCVFVDEGPWGLVYNPMAVIHTYNEAECGVAPRPDIGGCCEFFCFSSNCPTFWMQTCSSFFHCHALAQNICNDEIICT